MFNKRVQKVISLTAALGMAVSVLAGCGGSTKKVKITFAHHLAPTSIIHKSVEKFAELVKTKSNGVVEVSIAPSSQLGGQREIIEGVKLGTIQMGIGESGLYANYVPEFGLFSLPFIFNDLEHYNKVADGDIGKEFGKKLEDTNGIKILNWMDGGIRDVYMTKDPSKGLADMKGIKIRTPESPIYVNTFKSLGMNPTPVPAGEMYSALQSGVVDAMEGTVETAYTFKIYEVAKFCAETKHINTDISFMISKSFMEGLPQDIQTAILDAAKEAGEWERKEWASGVDAFKEKLKTEGNVKFVEVNSDELRKSVEPMYEEFIKKNPSAEQIINNIKNTK